MEKWSHFQELHRPENSLNNDIATEQIENFFSQLPSEKREILHMKYWEGMTINEIAKKRNQTSKQVENHLAKLRKEAREWFNRNEQTD